MATENYNREEAEEDITEFCNNPLGIRSSEEIKFIQTRSNLIRLRGIKHKTEIEIELLHSLEKWHDLCKEKNKFISYTEFYGPYYYALKKSKDLYSETKAVSKKVWVSLKNYSGF